MTAVLPRHLSAKAIADLQLDGLPATKRGVNRRAASDGWAFIERRTRGGSEKLYAVASLPHDARLDLVGRREKILPPRAARPQAANENIRAVGRPKGTGYFDRHPDVADAVEAILAERKLSAPRVLELLAADFAELPHTRSLRRFIADLERRKPALLTSMRDPDLFKSRYRPALGRADGGVTAAHQVWELDTTKADVMTRGGRKMVLGVIDRWSRRARFLVVESESGQSVRRLLIDTIRAWGVMPQCVATDNGSGFINASLVSALEVLGIEHRICPPGSPEKKPFVERLFGTFTRERAELLDGYAGHNVAEAQALRSKAKKETGRAIIVPQLDPDELQAILTNWTEGVYHQRTHGSLGMSPMQKWLASPAPATAPPDEDTLRIALSALVGTRKVGKRGIRWLRGNYWHAALAGFMGRDVIVRRDEDELGELFIFDEDYRFLGTAVNHEASGVSEREFAEAARRDFDEHMKAARAEARAKQRKFSPARARDALLRRDAEAAGKLTAFPARTTDRITDAVRSISDRPVPELPSEAELARVLAATAPAPKLPQSPAAKVAKADAVLTARRRGEDVGTDELAWAEAYSRSSEYRAEKMVQADFSDPASDRLPGSNQLNVRRMRGC